MYQGSAPPPKKKKKQKTKKKKNKKKTKTKQKKNNQKTEHKEFTLLFYQPRNNTNSHAETKLEKAANILATLSFSGSYSFFLIPFHLICLFHAFNLYVLPSNFLSRYCLDIFSL